MLDNVFVLDLDYIPVTSVICIEQCSWTILYI